MEADAELGQHRSRWRRIAAVLTIMRVFACVPVIAGDDPIHVVLFGSMEAAASTFVSSGAKIALDDVNREGFVALVSAGGGVRQERGSAAPGLTAPTLLRTTLLGATLGGYQFFYDWGVVGLFAGPEGSLEILGTGTEVFGSQVRLGLRLQGEVWARTSDTTLATATLIVGSARWDAYARVSAGYRLWDTYIGPEAAYYGDRTGYSKVSLGVHATDFAVGAVSFRASAGILYEPETERLGPYVALAAWAPL